MNWKLIDIIYRFEFTRNKNIVGNFHPFPLLATLYVIVLNS